MGISSPQIPSWCWEEKAVVTIGFTVPVSSIGHWALTTPRMSYMILTSQVPAMSLSQDQSHPIPSLLFGFSSSLSHMESLGFPSYLVIARHPPDSSSAISSPLAWQSHAPFPIWHFPPDCFGSDCIPFHLPSCPGRIVLGIGGKRFWALHWSIKQGYKCGGSPAFLPRFHGRECSLQTESLELLAALLRTRANWDFFFFFFQRLIT